jgi:hypothetical protein
VPCRFVAEKKRRFGKTKSAFSRVGVWLSRREKRDRRARRGEGERRVFSPRSRQNSTHEREKRKKAGKEKKKERRDLKSPHKNKFLASTTMADVQHERGYQKQVGVNVG